MKTSIYGESNFEITIQHLEGASEVLKEMLKRVERGWLPKSSFPNGVLACNSYGGREGGESRSACYWSTEGAFVRAVADAEVSRDVALIARFAVLNALGLPLQIVGRYLEDIDFEWEHNGNYNKELVSESVKVAMDFLAKQTSRFKRENKKMATEFERGE